MEAGVSGNASSGLVEACLKAATQGDFWRVQRRVLEQLPEPFANRLLQLLLEQNAVTAPTLDLFKYSVTSFAAPASLRSAISSEWLAYLSDFRYLSSLDLSQCSKLKDVHITPFRSLQHCLQHLKLWGCKGVTTKSGPTFAQLTNLVNLDLSETGITQPIASHLACLTQLTSLNLGGLPITDAACESLTVLTQLQNLVLWGSQVSEKSFLSMVNLCVLTSLDLSWSKVETIPLLRTIRQLNMSHCTLTKGLGDMETWIGWQECSLSRFNMTGAEVRGECSSALEELLRWSSGQLHELLLAGSQFNQMQWLQSMSKLHRLDLSGAVVAQRTSLIPLLGASSLTHLTINDAPLSPLSIAIVGLLPQLQVLELKHTNMNDSCFPWLVHLTALTSLDLSQNPDLTGLFNPVQKNLSVDLPEELMPTVAEATRYGRVRLPHDVEAAARQLQTLMGAEPSGFVNVWANEDQAQVVAQGQGDWGSGSVTPTNMATEILAPSPSLLQQGWRCFPLLRVLSLVDTALNNDACSLLSPHPSLTSLAIGSRHVKDRGLAVLAKITQLEQVSLKEVRAMDRAWKAFAGHDSLAQIKVEDCPLITKACLQALWDDLPQLQSVTENATPVPRRATPQRSRSRDASNLSKSPINSSLPRSFAPTSPLIPLKAQHLQPYDQRFKYGKEELLQLQDASEGDVSGQESGLAQMLDQIPVDIRTRTW